MCVFVLKSLVNKLNISHSFVYFFHVWICMQMFTLCCMLSVYVCVCYLRTKTNSEKRIRIHLSICKTMTNIWQLCQHCMFYVGVWLWLSVFNVCVYVTEWPIVAIPFSYFLPVVSPSSLIWLRPVPLPSPAPVCLLVLSPSAPLKLWQVSLPSPGSVVQFSLPCSCSSSL